MKKHKFLVLFVLVLFCFDFFSCKTIPENTVKVDPVYLLDSTSAFYLRVPSSVDPDFIQSMIQKNVEGISDSDAKRVVSRIDTVYLGVTRRRKSSEFQLASSCDFPQIALKKVFSKKNGWNTTSLELPVENALPSVYSIYEKSGLNVSFPTTNIALLGRNVPNMIQQYHNLAHEKDSIENYPVQESLLSWLSYEDLDSKNKIRFCTMNPKSFLTTLVGINLNYKLEYVIGQLENDPNNENQFFMDIEFEFIETKFLPSAKAMLALAFGLTDSDVYLKTPTHLVVSHVKINKKQLYKLLSF